MHFMFKTLDETAAHTITQWRYPGQYAIYNLPYPPDPAEMTYLLDPENRYFGLFDPSDQLVAFCSFGADAQVPGGDYRAPALDIGMGVRPDLTGRGRGTTFAAAVLHFAQHTWATRTHRVTIAAFNARAKRVWIRIGFWKIERFLREGDGMPFEIFLRDESRSP